MRLVLLRHGATAGNDAHRYVGRRTDEGLSPAGEEQCDRFGANDKVARVYTSPMLRARQTAARCFPRAELVAVPGLEEFDFGVFEGRRAQDMEHDEAYCAWVNSWCVGQCPGGESRDAFTLRTCDALDALLSEAEQRDENLVVVVAHGGTIMAALDGYYSKSVGNCEGYLVDVRMDAGHATFVYERPLNRAEQVL